MFDDLVANGSEPDDAERKVQKFSDTNKLKNKLKRLLKNSYVSLDIVMLNVIEKYAKVYMMTLDMEKEIEQIGLMYDYTNKAGEKNKTKNPIVSEYKSYIDQLNKLSKTILDATQPYADVESKDKLDKWLKKHERK